MPVMSSAWEKQAVSRLVRDALIQLCKSNQIYGGHVEVDALVCLTGKGEGQEIIVKVHEKLGSNEGRLALTDFLTRPRDGWHSIMSSSRGEDDAEDYSVKRPRLDDSYKIHEADSYPNLKQHLMTPSHARDLREIQDLRNRDSAKDLSMSSTARALDMSPPSPTLADQSCGVDSPSVSPGGPTENHRSSASSPHSIRYPFHSTPHSIYQRRIPLRVDRWSPNQPQPTIPECKPCGYIFNNIDVLSEHNEAVHSVFTCHSCFKTFTSRSNLERHSRLHSGHRPYRCTICGKSFSRKDHLSNHATKHAFKCGTCSKRFTDKKMLVTHYSCDHNAILTNICELCNKGFSSNAQYDEHLKNHPQCGDPDDDQPQNLSKSFIDTSPIKHVCIVCNFQTADKLTLLKHEIIHQDNARCYTCLSCAKMFDDPLRYSDHLLVHGNDTNIFECCICRHICSTLNSLRRHEATHLSMATAEETNSPTPESFPCPKCDKILSSRFNLEEHMELHVRSEGSFECTVCQEEFDSYSAICNHIEEEGHYAFPRGSENGTEAGGKNRRKQTVPKRQPEEEMAGESDAEGIEIVQPESPDDGRDDGAAGYIAHTSNGEFVITENPAPVIEISPDNAHESSHPMPIKNLLSKSIRTRTDNLERRSPQKSALATELGLIHRGSPSPLKRSPEKAATNSKGGEANNNSVNNNNNVMISSKLMNVEIPDGPFNCSICVEVSPTFQELEMHCFSEHNRSPCMFCNKTFAQKANRDRHVCLHTGEKPYSCPDCNEKFSRGDKLKIHRMRAHQTEFPPLPPRGGKDSSITRDLGASPGASPSGSQDSLALYQQQDSEWLAAQGVAGDNMYSAGEWSMKHAGENQFLPATGEWSVKEDSNSLAAEVASDSE